MCYAPMNVKLSGRKTNARRFVPCGKCARCEQRKRSDWAFRLHWESKDHPFSWFSLLTYNENTVPWLNTKTGEIVRLNPERPFDPQNINHIAELENDSEYQRVPQKEDVQLFVKRLRRQQEYYCKKEGWENTPIRYFIVSEYGERKTERPHYHAVLFGVNPYIQQKMVNTKAIWNNGIVTAKPLRTENPSGFLYLTKYLYKQQRIKDLPVRPFSMMSTQPYIGKRFEVYAKKYMYENRSMMIRSPTQLGVWQSIPQIYKDKIPSIQKAIFSNNDILMLDSNYIPSLDVLQKIGNKNEELLKLEKKAYYQQQYNEELQLMKYKLLKKTV